MFAMSRAELPGWSFHTFGRPAPQGSKRHVGGGRLVESSKKAAPWRQAVTASAFGAGERLEGPIVAVMVFSLPRPASARRDDLAPSRTPDLSKLVRSTEDAITDAGLWADDARVVAYCPAAKVYAGAAGMPGVDPRTVLPVPGVMVAAVSVAARSTPDGDAPAPLMLAGALPVPLADAAKALSLPQVAVLALAGGNAAAVTSDAVDGWLVEAAADRDRFAARVVEARRSVMLRRHAARIARATPPSVPDPSDTLGWLLDVESARVAERSSRSAIW